MSEPKHVMLIVWLQTSSPEETQEALDAITPVVHVPHKSSVSHKKVYVPCDSVEEAMGILDDIAKVIHEHFDSLITSPDSPYMDYDEPNHE